MQFERIFLVDPVCAQEFGHNPRSLVTFANYLSGMASNILSFASAEFQTKDPAYESFYRYFGYWYDHVLPLASRQGQSSIYPFSLRHPALLRDAISQFDRFLTEHGISKNDALFLPSADFYSTVGLLSALRKNRFGEGPKVHLRFIGVMEHGAAIETNPFRIFRRLLKGSPNIYVSAESPRYAEELKRRLRRPVSTTVYPVSPRMYERGETSPFVVYLAGAARLDKGFLRILGIARRYFELWPDDDVIFRVQGLPAREETQHAEYLSQLLAAPNIQLLSGLQSDAEMETNYAQAHFSLMPYDAATYRLRGSAITMESIERGIPFAITAGTGLQSLVAELPSGYACACDDEFCAAIHDWRSLSEGERTRRARQSADIMAHMACAGMARLWSAETC